MDADANSQLAELLERERIRELLHRYCYAVDRGTLEEVMALFDDDCNLELAPGRKYLGRAAVHRWYERYMRSRMGVLRHLIHNQVIDLDRTQARSRSYFDAVGDLKGESIVVAGLYEDRLRKRGAEWKFAEKVIRLDFLVPLHEGWGGKRFKRTIIGDVDCSAPAADI